MPRIKSHHARVDHTAGQYVPNAGRIAGGPVYGRNADGSAKPVTIVYADGRTSRTITHDKQPTVTRRDLERLKAAWSA